MGTVSADVRPRSAISIHERPAAARKGSEGKLLLESSNSWVDLSRAQCTRHPLWRVRRAQMLARLRVAPTTERPPKMTRLSM